MNPVKVLLKPSHVGSEVNHLGVDSVGEVLDQAVEVIHLELDALEALAKDEAQVGFVLGHFDFVIEVRELLLHLLLSFLESFAGASACRGGSSSTVPCTAMLVGALTTGLGRLLSATIAVNLSGNLTLLAKDASFGSV